MKHCLFYLLAISFCPTTLFGQYYFYDGHRLEPEWRVEVGLSVGSMNCLTDLGGNKGNGSKLLKDVNWNYSKPTGGVYISATRHDLIAVRLGFAAGSVTATDSILKGLDAAATLRYMRNLHFRSRILEGSIVAEFHPLYIKQAVNHILSPYVLAGIGMFSFKPEAYIDGSWTDLKPLRTEGQGFKEYPTRQEYSLRQINIPIGVGLKYDLSELLTTRIEFEYRILCTDYLDDVSERYVDPSLFYKYFSAEQARIAQSLADRTGELDPSHRTVAGAIRGNPGNKDAYFTLQLRFGFILNRRKFN